MHMVVIVVMFDLKTLTFWPHLALTNTLIQPAMTTAYGQRVKFAMAEHSATAEGEKCGYGPTLSYLINKKIDPSTIFFPNFQVPHVQVFKCGASGS